MPPFLASLANVSSPSSSFPHAAQPTGIYFGISNQNQWGPDAIGTIFFGVVMVFIGITALWQGRLRMLRHEEDEEQGRQARVGGRPTDLAEEVAIAELPEEFGSERVAVGVDESPREDDTMEQEEFAKIERGVRRDTDGTLVGQNDDGSEVKDLEV